MKRRRTHVRTTSRDWARIYRDACRGAYEEGARAARDGEGADTNPWPSPEGKRFSCSYDHPTAMHRAWRLGWTEEQESRKA